MYFNKTIFTLQHPYCTSIDIQTLFKDDWKTPTQIFFYIKAKLKQPLLSFYVEDRNKRLKRRPLKSNMLSYVGPDMSGISLRGVPNRIRMMYAISQLIDSEEDDMKKCKNYPYNGFLNYQECDEDFVINKFRKIYNDNILPFWVVDDLEKVTKTRSHSSLIHQLFDTFNFRYFDTSSLTTNDENNILDLVDGTLKSHCYRPCLASKELS